MALQGIPISEDQCMGDSLHTINAALTSLDVCCESNSRKLNSLSLGNTEDYIIKPSLPTNKDLLVYSEEEEVWKNQSTFDAFVSVMGDGMVANSTTKRFDITPSNLPTDYASKLVPTGAVMMFCSVAIPNGWKECNGSSLDKTQPENLDLFNLLQYTFGGSGNNFSLPDLRGLFVRGWDNERGFDPNRTLGSFQDEAFKSHTHTFMWGQNSAGALIAGNSVQTYSSKVDIAGDHIESTGGTETRPKNMALIYCIKL